MKYLCLIAAESLMEQMSEAEAAQHLAEYHEVLEGMKQSGHYIGCSRLQPPDAAITVRVRGGKVHATDGPFVETKEQLGGFFLIEAKDMNEAIQLASRIPGARIGCVEVRPLANDAPTRESLGLQQT